MEWATLPSSVVGYFFRMKEGGQKNDISCFGSFCGPSSFRPRVATQRPLWATIDERWIQGYDAGGVSRESGIRPAGG